MEEPNTINNSPGSGIKFYDQRDGRICRRSLTGNYNKLSMTHSNSTNAVTGKPYAGHGIVIEGNNNHVTALLRSVNGTLSC